MLMPPRERFLVTGGAGFIGSHMVLALLDRGAEVVVLDNLSTGHAGAVPAGVRLITADLADRPAVCAAVADVRWDAVFHFASLSLVGDSMAAPFRYLRENITGGLNLIEACAQAGVARFILSSTANLFGAPDVVPINADAAIRPGSPYGESKYVLERMLRWADRLHGMRSACLRYFNAAGADPLGRAGEDHRPETHLIPAAIDAALGRSAPLRIFGDSYDTPDGTCIRDFIHVSDLAQAHLSVLPALDAASVTLNIGIGRGYSVRDVVAAVGQIIGRDVPCERAAPRPGDPAVLVADPARLRALTGWAPRFGSLEPMVRTAYAWRLAHPTGYDGAARARTG